MYNVYKNIYTYQKGSQEEINTIAMTMAHMLKRRHTHTHIYINIYIADVITTKMFFDLN